jgi:hypothetical protein
MVWDLSTGLNKKTMKTNFPIQKSLSWTQNKKKSGKKQTGSCSWNLSLSWSVKSVAIPLLIWYMQMRSNNFGNIE